MNDSRRLDLHLIKLGFAQSRREARELLASGRVRVNGRILRKGEAINGVCEIQVSGVTPPPGITPDPALDIPVLYADPVLLVVNKPGLIPCHPLRPHETGTVMNGVAAQFPETALCGDKPLEGGLVHRLDNGTSGVLLIARTAAALAVLRAALRQGEIHREYRALISGDLTEPVEITAPIAHHSHNRRKMVAGEPGRSRPRPAFTAAAPLERYGNFTLVSVRPRTGCRHQIRIHLATIGHPLAGDILYGAPSQPGLAAGRIWLHLTALELTSPANGRIRVAAPLPEDLALPAFRHSRDRSGSAAR